MDRIEEELRLLKQYFPEILYREDGRWVLFPRYALPEGRWSVNEVRMAVQFPPGFPGNGPYAFQVSPRLRLANGSPPSNSADSAEPPFGGEWLKFSWSLPEWRATADIQTGFNMLNFVLTIKNRLEETN
jgi:hypothetical protein